MNYFHSELKRNFWSYKMLTGIILGILTYAVETYLYVKEYIFFDYNAPDLIGQEEAIKMMISKALNVSHVWFRSLDTFPLLLPIIACLPYATSFFLERKNGSFKNLLIRMNWKKYLWTKISVNAILGGIIVTIPIIIHSIFLFLVFSKEKIELTLYPSGAFSHIFIQNTILYIIIYIGIIFAFGVAFACLGLALSNFAKNVVWAMMGSFTVFLVSSIAMIAVGLHLYAPYIVANFYSYKASKSIHLIIVVTYLIVGSIIAFIKSVKKEI